MSVIVFDYDGVLADTLDDLLRFGQMACNDLGVHHKVNKDDLANLEEMSFASFGRACGVPDHLVDEFVQICLSGIAGKESPSDIFNGLSEILRQLAVKQTMAVVTTNSSQNVHAFLVKHKLDDCFRAVYGVDSPGSKVQKISLARDRLSAGGNQASVFMVGDSLSDIHAAKEALATSIAVTWGHQSLEYLLRGKPDYVVNHPHELTQIIEG